MRILADESVDGEIVRALRAAGYEVDYAAELDPGASDETVLRRAKTARAVLVTADKDFGELVFRQRRASSGVVLVRLAGLSQARKAAIVVGAFERHGAKMSGAFSVVTGSSIRVRSARGTSARPRA